MRKKSQKPVNKYITEPDYQRLSGLIQITRERNGVDPEYLKLRAHAVAVNRVNMVSQRTRIEWLSHVRAAVESLA